MFVEPVMKDLLKLLLQTALIDLAGSGDIRVCLSGRISKCRKIVSM